MYKHSAVLEVRVIIETEESLSSDELEEMLHDLDYEFSSEYGSVSTRIEESSFTQMNRLVK